MQLRSIFVTHQLLLIITSIIYEYVSMDTCVREDPRNSEL